MKKALIRYYGIVIVLLVTTKAAYTQRFDDIYRSANANIIQVFGDSSIENVVKGATVILPNSSSQLTILVRIPFIVVNKFTVLNLDSLNSGYLFLLKLPINLDEIQQVLTSTKMFQSRGTLTLNNITKAIAVKYMPMVSGTNQQGDFNIFLRVQFKASDFNLDSPDSNLQFILMINNAPVNRI